MGASTVIRVEPKRILINHRTHCPFIGIAHVVLAKPDSNGIKWIYHVKAQAR